jgi:para-nitrobenzyl esterase
MTPHGLGIGFVFDNVDKATSMVGVGGDQQHMADLMSDAWIAFARTGDPQTPALPAWRPYDSKTRATMIFNSKPKVENDPEAADRLLFTTLRF